MDEISIGFSRLSDTGLAAVASRIHTALTTVPGNAFFPAADPTPATLKTTITGFQNALAGEDTAANVALRDSSRKVLIRFLKRLAANLELTADGDLAKLAASGFDLRKKPVRGTGPPPAPLDLRVKHTGIQGQVLAKCKAVNEADAYEAQSALDPEGPWTSIDVVSNSQNILFTGLTRGKDYFFRVRAIDPHGPSGWSDIATLMVV